MTKLSSVGASYSYTLFSRAIDIAPSNHYLLSLSSNRESPSSNESFAWSLAAGSAKVPLNHPGCFRREQKKRHLGYDATIREKGREKNRSFRPSVSFSLSIPARIFSLGLSIFGFSPRPPIERGSRSKILSRSRDGKFREKARQRSLIS